MSNYKIILLGDTGVGKTSIITKYIHNTYDEKEQVRDLSCSRLLGLISLARISAIGEIDVVCNCGTVRDKKDI